MTRRARTQGLTRGIAPWGWRPRVKPGAGLVVLVGLLSVTGMARAGDCPEPERFKDTFRAILDGCIDYVSSGATDVLEMNKAGFHDWRLANETPVVSASCYNKGDAWEDSYGLMFSAYQDEQGLRVCHMQQTGTGMKDLRQEILGFRPSYDFVEREGRDGPVICNLEAETPFATAIVRSNIYGIYGGFYFFVVSRQLDEETEKFCRGTS